MSLSRSASLGILACPGGARFAGEVTSHLKAIYLKKFARKAAMLAERYGEDVPALIRKINFSNDLHTPHLHLSGSVDSYRPPSFRLKARFTRFANGEFKTEILSSVRGMDIYVFQDVANHQPMKFTGSDAEAVLSINDHIMCLLVTVDAALQAGANTVTVVIPSYPYARQHKKKGREGLTAARMGQILEYMGVSRIITLDIHSREIENSFNKMRLENLHASYQIMRKLAKIIDPTDPDLVVVSPDTGAVDRNKFYAGNLQKPLALLYKERDYSKLSRSASDNNITTMRLLGSVEGKTVFMADDILGTGGTLIKAMSHIRELGALKIICAVSIPLFTDTAIQEFDDAYRAGLFYRIIGTNAVHHGEELLSKEWYVCANVSNLFARIISRLHHDLSLSALLDNRNIIQSMLKKK